MNQIKRNRPRGAYGRKPNRPNNNGQHTRQNPARTKQHATQMMEKYLLLYKEKRMSGDRVEAENYRQYADHYFRVLAEANAQLQEMQEQQQPEKPQAEEPLDPDQPTE